MTANRRAPRLTDKQLLGVRVAAVLLSYGLYRLLEPRGVVAAVILGVGALMVMYQLIDRIALPRRERLEMLEVGTILLGVGLLGLGVYLLLR